MCGIVGFFSGEEDKAKTIKKMANRIIHRGPDQEGYYTDEKIALGHRRLSIIDLNNGTQPMYSKDENLVVIFNGEIYNYIELREELIKENHEFKTNSDTEVLLHGYEQWGSEMPKKLRGMFAFAIWDKKNETLFLSRDHFGIKPLYYYKKDDVFMFASEIKAFLDHPKFSKTVNKEILGAYLSFSFTPTTETFFKGVYCLEPGHNLTLKNNEINIEQYYELKFSEDKKDFDKIVDEISETMKDSIEHHMISDVEVGSFLSSGIDSSYVVSLAKPDKTYTVGYDDENYSEIKYAEDLANQLGIKNISKKITKEEYMSNLPKILYHLDEPFPDPAAISLYFVSELASKEVKVVMSGEGADEFFGGYNTYGEEVMLSSYNKIPYVIRHIFAMICRNLPDIKGRDFIVRRGTKLEEQYIGINSIFGEKERKKILSFKDTMKNKEITKPIFEKHKNNSSMAQKQAVDIKLWLLKDILQKADRMTMANSIEGRTPFTDKEVFELASTIAPECKVSKANTKIALREAAKKDIPTEAYKKKKLGFPVPLREWMRQEDVYNEIKRAVNQEFVKEFFNQKQVMKLLDQHKNHKKDTYKKVWAIYCFIKWYEIFFLDENNNIHEDMFRSKK